MDIHERYEPVLFFLPGEIILPYFIDGYFNIQEWTLISVTLFIIL